MRRSLILLPFVLVAAAACASGSIRELRDREWKMVSVDGLTAMPAGIATPTVRFDTDGRFSGNTGCNSAGAAYTVERDTLNIRTLLVTKRACLDPEGNRLERAYMEAIGKTRRFRIENDRLDLLSGDGAVVARFE
jgi:heat shock protein HslJ